MKRPSIFLQTCLILSLFLLPGIRAYPSSFSLQKHNRGGVYLNPNKIPIQRVTHKKITSSALFGIKGGKNSGALKGKIFKRRNIIGGVLGTVAAVIGGGEIYARLGDGRKYDQSLANPEKGWDNVEDATIVFHGAAGPDSYTDSLTEKCRKKQKESTYYTLVDWSKYSQDTLQASFNGQIIGEKIAYEIIQKTKNLKSLHIVGISVGAFAADSLVKQYKEKGGNDVFVQLTLLDPFCLRGTLGFSYGANQYGLKADYAQQYLNTDDPVPSTNSPLPKCAVTDVTNVRPPEIFGHDWPLVYYTKYCDVSVVPKSDRRPHGNIMYINTLPTK